MRITYSLLPLTLALLAMTSGCHRRHCCCGGCVAPCCSPCCSCCYEPVVESPVPPLAAPAPPVTAPHIPMLGSH